MKRSYFSHLLLIAACAAALFIPFIGECPLFDWDEVNFAECAREMIVSGDYSHVQLNYRPFWEKPPVFIWMQALSMNAFGVNAFAARLPNAICSVFTLITLYTIGRRIFSESFGLRWVLVYAATMLPHFYFRSGIIDPWFNLFILLAIYNCHVFLNDPYNKRRMLRCLFGGLCLGLAVLTKGPVALLIAALTIVSFLGFSRQLSLLLHKGTLVFIISSLTVAGSWFLIEWLKGNQEVVKEFVDYQIRLFNTEDAGHSGPFFYHGLVLLAGCFPSSILFIAGYRSRENLTPYQRSARIIMLSMFWVVLIIFSLVQTKIVHYSSLCYFPLTFIATIAVTPGLAISGFSKLQRFLYWFIAGIVALALVAITTLWIFREQLLSSGLISDPLAAGNLAADADWKGYEWVIPLIFLSATVCLFRGIEKSRPRLMTLSLVLFISFISLAVYLIIPRINEYTQEAAIQFYRERAKENCYVETHNFKSYAYLFYSERKPSDYTNPDQQEFIRRQMALMETEGRSLLTSFAVSNLLWMEHGRIDRPAYIVVKTHEEKDMARLTNTRKLYDKNGYSFFVRVPEK